LIERGFVPLDADEIRHQAIVQPIPCVPDLMLFARRRGDSGRVLLDAGPAAN